jgi:hypothetical protein
MVSRLASSAYDLGSSADGRVLAIPNLGRGAIVLLPAEKRLVTLEPQEDVRHAAVSPDGRWVATGSHSALKGPGAKVWDARSGQVVRALSVPGFCCVRFSPDKKWLLTTGGGYKLWSVGDWTEGPPLETPATGSALAAGAFSADGSLLALQDVPGVVRLVAPATGKEVARLTAPEPSLIRPFCFTTDGTRLVCVDAEKESLLIFDLRSIRAQLVKLGLDWDAPPYPPASAALPEPLDVEVAGTDLTANELNSQAWRLVVGPVDQRNPAHALQLVQEALEQQPGNSHLLNTLGVVQYRRGQCAEAVKALEKSLAADRAQSIGSGLFFLAMCHGKLGARDKARDCFDRAVQWWAGRRGLSLQHLSELVAFRAEAEAVLGLK